MTPRLVSQRTWAKELGISVWTFRRWLAVGRIPQPLDLTGWPRWSRKTVDRVNAEIERSGEGRYFRTAQTRRRHRAFKAQASRFQQGQRPSHPSALAVQDVGDVHAVQDAPIAGADHLHSLDNAR